MNAIEVAEALRDRYGNDVCMFAASGLLNSLVEQKGIRFIEAPTVTHQPWRTIYRSLSQALDQEKPDLVQVWSWHEYLLAFYPVCIERRIPLLVTDMLSDKMFRGLPRFLMTTWGTAELAEIARRRGRRGAKVLVPPVDIHANSPEAVLPEKALRQFENQGFDFTIVTVTRVAELLKSESIERTMHSIEALSKDFNIRFFLVGDGDAFERLQCLASEINSRQGRPAIVLTGELVDPRPAYAMADIVIGMGGSAIRGLAFEKPVIVVGNKGFSKLVSPDTASYFLYKGFYGIGDGDADNAQMTALIASLLQSENKRTELAVFGRSFVEEHYSIGAVCSQLQAYIDSSIKHPTPFFLCILDGLRTIIILSFSKRGLCALLRRFGRLVPYRLRRQFFKKPATLS